MEQAQLLDGLSWGWVEAGEEKLIPAFQRLLSAPARNSGQGGPYWFCPPRPYNETGIKPDLSGHLLPWPRALKTLGKNFSSGLLTYIIMRLVPGLRAI